MDIFTTIFEEEFINFKILPSLPPPGYQMVAPLCNGTALFSVSLETYISIISYTLPKQMIFFHIFIKLQDA